MREDRNSAGLQDAGDDLLDLRPWSRLHLNRLPVSDAEDVKHRGVDVVARIPLGSGEDSDIFPKFFLPVDPVVRDGNKVIAMRSIEADGRIPVQRPVGARRVHVQVSPVPAASVL